MSASATAPGKELKAMELTGGVASAFMAPQGIYWKRFLASFRSCKLRHLLSISTIVSLCFSTICGLTCHCINGEPCNQENAECAGGCDPGWYGPGCQVGNLALRKPAKQSTTFSIYTANFAVNGIMPQSGDMSSNNCSETSSDTGTADWWLVELSNNEDFVVKNISIVSRDEPFSNRLQDFYILYTRNTTGIPDTATWKICRYQSFYSTEILNTYTCGTTAIGRRIAIYMPRSSRQYKMLTLCEVYVDGYPYIDTVILNNLQVLPANYGDIITGNIDSTKPVVPHSFLVFFLNSTEDEFRIPIATNGRNFSVTVSDMVNVTYSVSAAPATCCYESKCPIQNTDIATFSYDKCVIGQSTHLFVLVPGQSLSSSPPTTSESLERLIPAAVGGAVACIALVTVIVLTLLLIRRRRAMATTEFNSAGHAIVGENTTHNNKGLNLEYENCKTSSQTATQLSGSIATISNDGPTVKKAPKNNGQKLEECESDYSQPISHDVTYASLNTEAILHNREEYAALGRK